MNNKKKHTRPKSTADIFEQICRRQRAILSYTAAVEYENEKEQDAENQKKCQGQCEESCVAENCPKYEVKKSDMDQKLATLCKKQCTENCVKSTCSKYENAAKNIDPGTSKSLCKSLCKGSCVRATCSKYAEVQGTEKAVTKAAEQFISRAELCSILETLQCAHCGYRIVSDEMRKYCPSIKAAEASYNTPISEDKFHDPCSEHVELLVNSCPLCKKQSEVPVAPQQQYGFVGNQMKPNCQICPACGQPVVTDGCDVATHKAQQSKGMEQQQQQQQKCDAGQMQQATMFMPYYMPQEGAQMQCGPQIAPYTKTPVPYNLGGSPNMEPRNYTQMQQNMSSYNKTPVPYNLSAQTQSIDPTLYKTFNAFKSCVCSTQTYPMKIKSPNRNADKKYQQEQLTDQSLQLSIYSNYSEISEHRYGPRPRVPKLSPSYQKKSKQKEKRKRPISEITSEEPQQSTTLLYKQAAFKCTASNAELFQDCLNGVMGKPKKPKSTKTTDDESLTTATYENPKAFHQALKNLQETSKKLLENFEKALENKVESNSESCSIILHVKKIKQSHRNGKNG